MKNILKYFISLLSVFIFFSLSLFPVFAEVPTSYTLSDTNLIGLLNYPDLDLSTDIVYVGNNGRIQIISPRFGSVTIANNEVKYTGKRIEYDGSKWNDVNANGTVTLGFSWSGVIFLNIPNQQKFCKVVTNASQVPDCLNQLNWSADFNNLLSDPYIAQGVGYAREHLWDNWEIAFRIYPPMTSYETVVGVHYLSEPGIYYQYQLTNLDSNEVYLYEGFSSPSLYIYNGPNGSTGYAYTITYGPSLGSHVVLRSTWLPKSIDTNTLIDQGNSSSQSASSSIDSVTSSLDSSSSQFESFESQFNSSLTSSLDNIDIDSIDLVNSSDFVTTAAWVKLQFDDILASSGIYKTAISFVLIIGLALLLLGRRL